ncbi:MAG TPA: nuclear transport factor 2 family protein [Terriglobales bacterium]|nr:nuclear transport factor 2 family protein [Terriglobales bacterium]
MTGTQRQILRLEREQARDFNRHDLGALLAQFGPGFMGFSSTRHKRVSGRKELASTFRHYFDRSPRAQYRIAQPRVQVLGGVAVASFYWTVTLSPRRKVEGRGSHVYAKGKGGWKIVHEHFSKAH